MTPGAAPEAATFQRRAVLRSLAAALAAGGLLPLASAIEREGETVLEALHGIFSDPAGARLIGADYLRRHPEEGDSSRLCEALFGGCRPQTRDGLVTCFAAQRARELASGDLLLIEGWLLTRGEARLCALLTATAAAE